jgi:hypothetical protein
VIVPDHVGGNVGEGLLDDFAAPAQPIFFRERSAARGGIRIVMQLENIRIVFVDVNLVAHHEQERRLRFLDEFRHLWPDAVGRERATRNRAEKNRRERVRIGHGAERTFAPHHAPTSTKDRVGVFPIATQARRPRDGGVKFQARRFGAGEVECARAGDTQFVIARIIEHLDPDFAGGVVGVADDWAELQPVQRPTRTHR